MPPLTTPTPQDGLLEQIKAWGAPVATFLGAAIVAVGAFLSSRSSNRVLTLSHDTLSAKDLLLRLETVEQRVYTLEQDKDRLESLVDERDKKISFLEIETERLKAQNRTQANEILELQGIKTGPDTGRDFFIGRQLNIPQNRGGQSPSP